MRKLALIAATALAFVLPMAASAQNQNCAPREVVVERLADRYGESRQAIGLGSNNAVVEVFANTEGGSWTITVTMPNGITCLVASGQAYENVNETLPEPQGDPT